ASSSRSCSYWSLSSVACSAPTACACATQSGLSPHLDRNAACHWGMRWLRASANRPTCAISCSAFCRTSEASCLALAAASSRGPSCESTTACSSGGSSANLALASCDQYRGASRASTGSSVASSASPASSGVSAPASASSGVLVSPSVFSTVSALASGALCGASCSCSGGASGATSSMDTAWSKDSVSGVGAVWSVIDHLVGGFSSGGSVPRGPG